jgi:peptide/nickel transport system ATP-binding protein
VALVGESGSGKTTIATDDRRPPHVGGGRLTLDSNELPAGAHRRSHEERRRIQIVFQNPADALNPRQTVRAAISRPARLLRQLSMEEADAEVARLLDLVRLPQWMSERLPSQLSGGDRQRVGIAGALAADPSVIVCDEVTSALDVSVQAAVLESFAGLRRDLGLALLVITHDLGVVAKIADEILVLEKGKVVEQGHTLDILRNPQQPYTQQLIAAAPSVSHAVQAWKEWDENADPSR